MLYQILDTRSGTVIAWGLNRKRAEARADRMDLEYGAVRYVVRPDNIAAREPSPVVVL